MENGFYIAIGKQGSGKTILITKLATEDYLETKRTIYSNYELKKLPHQKINLQKILDLLDKDVNSLNNSIILLDEIHLYLDSYDFMRKNNRKLQTFFSQLRKRNILLLGTTQYIMNVDVRIRRQCKYVFDMEHIYKDLFKVTTCILDGYLAEPVSKYDILLNEYYDSYDTNEIIVD